MTNLHQVHTEFSSKLLGLTKYVVGANANPPKNPRRPPKKGKVMAMNMVNAVKFATEISEKNQNFLLYSITFQDFRRGEGVKQ